MASGNHYQVVIIGSGPAGLTAAIYASRANLKVLVLEGYASGGQLMITTEVENYPGFPQGVSGPELMDLWRQQAAKFGAELRPVDITKVDLSGESPFKVYVEEEEIRADTVIIATGARARWLGLESEKKLIGFGVSACATCDGFFFREKVVAVVGGGDTALEEANYLTHHASKVYLIHRRNELRGSKILQKRAFDNPKIEIIWDSVIIDVLGEKDTGVTGVNLKNVKSGELSRLPLDGLFIAIGHSPTTDLFKDYLDLDENGYILAEPGSSRTNIPGVFAAGDVRDQTYRQAVTAAGSGCMAAIDAERWLEARERR